MKKSLTYLLIATMFVFGSCTNNEETDWCGVKSYQVQSCFGDSLRSGYPDAKFVEWEWEKGYFVANFRTDGFETEAWFNADANWVMTVSEISYKALPTTIAELHAKMYIDDIHRIERPYFTDLYMLDFAQSEVLYTAQGLLVAEAIDLPDAYPIEISETLRAELLKLYAEPFQLVNVVFDGSVWTIWMLTEVGIEETKITL